MANITLSDLQPSTAETGLNQSVRFIETTATGFINPIISGVARVSSNTAVSQNFNIGSLDSPVTGNRSSVPGSLTGRRPTYGQLFPRGYFNR